MKETITCYRPVGEKELELIKYENFSAFPPRLPEQPIFYPVTNERYAIEITEWNLTDFGKGYVTKFEVDKEFISKYPIQCVGADHHTEWWIPAEDLTMFNQNIVGKIEVIGEYQR